MAIVIRLSRLGRRNRPHYRVGVFDERTRRVGPAGGLAIGLAHGRASCLRAALTPGNVAHHAGSDIDGCQVPALPAP